jgi:hypothetical protein
VLPGFASEFQIEFSDFSLFLRTERLPISAPSLPNESAGTQVSSRRECKMMLSDAPLGGQALVRSPSEPAVVSDKFPYMIQPTIS